MRHQEMDTQLHIAICDDSLSDAGQLEQILLQLLGDMGRKCQIDVYSSGQELLKSLNQAVYYDIIFMDIEMDDTDGITTGIILRDDLDNDDTVLVYVSAHEQYCRDLFQNKPICFIQKPLAVRDVHDALLRSIRDVERKAGVFVYTSNGRIVRKRKADILYFEINGKNMKLVFHQSEDRFRLSMEKLLQSLESDSSFIRVHRSYVVNLGNVDTFEGRQLYFKNGHTVPISAKLNSTVRRALVNYIFEHDVPSNLD